MTWKGGFDRSYNEKQLRERISAAVLHWKPQGIVLHNTGAPNLSQWKNTPGGEAQRLKNLAHYYRNQKKWPSGPHFFIGEWIWEGTPIEYPGTHSPSFNGTHVGVEAAGDYSKDIWEDPVKTNTITTLAILCEVLKLDPSRHIKLHKEDPKTTHKDCPGKNIQKAAIIAAVQAKMAGATFMLPPDAYTVQKGDTLYGLARKWGIALADLILANGGSTAISVGQQIALSAKKAILVQQGAATKTSREGRIFIAREEGVALQVYMDGPTPAVGMGHNDKTLKPGERITLELAMSYFEKDIVWADKVILKAVKVPLTQHQFDACSSLLHNIGSGNFSNSAVVRFLNEGKYEEAAQAFLRWHRANGKDDALKPRREREIAIFAKGDYGKLDTVPVWTGDPRTTKPVRMALP